MKRKRYGTALEAIERMKDDSVVFVGGFGRGGVPERLIEAVCQRRLRGLTVVSNNAGTSQTGIARLLRKAACARSCSFRWRASRWCFAGQYDRGLVESRSRAARHDGGADQAGGAGLGGILTPTGGPISPIRRRSNWTAGCICSSGRCGRIRAGVGALRSMPRHLVYRKAARNFIRSWRRPRTG